MAKSRLEACIIKNLTKVTKFFRKNLDIRLSSRPEKIRINCPYCSDNTFASNRDTNYHMTLNLDWGVAKCFRCGAAHPIITVMNKIGLHDAYLDLLQDISDLSLYDLQSIIRHEAFSPKQRVEEDKAKKFVKDHGLVPVSNLKHALAYAKERTRNDSSEIEMYYADECYIYVPIFKDRKIVAFIARRYIEGIPKPRYKYIKLFEEYKPVAFIDEVEENISGDTIYITEGYFDALAINSSYNSYCAVAIFSKSNSENVVENFYSSLPPDARIVIALDSYAKDGDIYYNIDQLYKKLKQYFQSIDICLLPDHDPNEIFVNEGPSKLVETLEKYTVSSSEYEKRRILGSSLKSKKFVKQEVVNTLRLPDFLLRAKG